MDDKKTYAVRYFSKTGNTKKLADTIAKTVGCNAYTCQERVEKETDVLFLGASVYAAGIDEEVKQFIQSLDAKKVKCVAVFSTSALAQRALPAVTELLHQKGIKVSPQSFYCRGKFMFMHKGRPNESDLQAVSEFAKKIMKC